MITDSWWPIMSSLVKIRVKMQPKCSQTTNLAKNYPSVTDVITGPWSPSIDMVMDSWPFTMSSLVKIRPKMQPRTLSVKLAKNYSTVTARITRPWRPSKGIVTDPWPFIMSNLVKIRPKFWPRILTNYEISQKLPDRDSCDYRTVMPINRYGHWIMTIHHVKFGEDPT